MKVSTIAATSIITASTAVSGNAATNLRKLKTATSESGNKFRKLGGFVDHSVCELVCDDDNSTDEIQKKHCEEEKLFGCICQGKACQACPKYEICAKCDGVVQELHSTLRLGRLAFQLALSSPAMIIHSIGAASILATLFVPWLS